jgi:hypothetical protein
MLSNLTKEEKQVLLFLTAVFLLGLVINYFQKNFSAPPQVIEKKYQKHSPQ